MGFITANQLVYEYFRRDEEGNVEAIQTALDQVDLQVEAGQFISILGHNGSGKSTLAKHLNALLTPASGTVIVDGKDTSQSSNQLPIRMETGMVFQNPDNQIVSGIVEEDVAFGPENIGIPTEEIHLRVQDALALMQLLDYQKKSPNHLSGGQKQRVAIAGVMAMRPKTIIMDEPTAMLDPMGRREVLRAAHYLNKEQGITIILITHYMEEVIGSDYVYVMEKGKILAEGSDREIFSQIHLLQEHGLSVPQITLVADALRKQGLNLPHGILTRAELVAALKEISHVHGH